MYKILFLVILIIPCAKVFGQEIKNLNDWAKILHMTSDNTKDITDKSFYLTNGSLIDEIKEFKKIASKEFGQDLVCQFPARYLLLKETFSNIKNYSLEGCKQLVRFIKSFKNRYVSLIITSELLNAPASAFGHVLLLFHEQEIPEMSSDVIHFSAIPDKSDNFFTYAYKGLTGKYNGYYLRNKFFEKHHEYSNVEQRYLFSHRLKISKWQRRRLLLHLFELRKSKFNYYFINKNCGFRIGTLLSVVYGKSLPDNLLYTLPVEIPFIYEKQLDKTVKFSPYSSIAMNYIQKLTKSDEKIFDKIIKGKKIINSENFEVLKKAVSYYYIYSFKKNINALPNYKENLINAKTLFSNTLKDKIKSPVDKPKPSKLQIGGGKLNSHHFSTIKIRPFLTDIDMYQENNLHESELTLLNTSLVKLNNKIFIDELDLLSVKVYAPHSKYFSNLSWQGNLSINRRNIFQNKGINFNVGLGKSYRFLGLSTFLINLGTDNNHDNYKLYMSPEINIFIYALSKIKFAVNFKKKIYSEESLDIFESKLTYLLNKKHDLLIKYNKNGNFDKRVSLSTGYYF